MECGMAGLDPGQCQPKTTREQHQPIDALSRGTSMHNKAHKRRIPQF